MQYFLKTTQSWITRISKNLHPCSLCNCDTADCQHSAGYPYLRTAVRSIKLVTGFYLKMVNNCRYFRSSGNLLGLKIFLSNKYLYFTYFCASLLYSIMMNILFYVKYSWNIFTLLVKSAKCGDWLGARNKMDGSL